jgi:hypothetical protein
MKLVHGYNGKFKKWMLKNHLFVYSKCYLALNYTGIWFFQFLYAFKRYIVFDLFMCIVLVSRRGIH